MNIIESGFSFALSLYEASSEMFLCRMSCFHSSGWISSIPGRLFLRFLSAASERVRIVSDDDVSMRAHPRFRRQEIACSHAFSCEGGALWKPLVWYTLIGLSSVLLLTGFCSELASKRFFLGGRFRASDNLQNKQYFFASSDENFFTRASQVCEFFPLVLFQFWLQTARVCLLVLISSTRASLWGNKQTAGLIACSLDGSCLLPPWAASSVLSSVFWTLQQLVRNLFLFVLSPEFFRQFTKAYFSREHLCSEKSCRTCFKEFVFGLCCNLLETYFWLLSPEFFTKTSSIACYSESSFFLSLVADCCVLLKPRVELWSYLTKNCRRAAVTKNG